MKALNDVMKNGRVEIDNKECVIKKLMKIIEDGENNLRFIVDFDYTLTRAHKNGTPVDCSWGVFENYHELPQKYHENVKLVKDKYYPIEIDLSISLEEKIPLMIEWYKEANRLLSESEVNISWFPKMVAESNCELRDGAILLLNALNEAKIPVLVMSAGLGDLIEAILSHYGVLHSNTNLVSNFLEFDINGIVTGLRHGEEVIHMFNKSKIVQSKSEGTEYAERKNVVLLGDSLGDLQMADGVKDPEVVLSIGFLNKNISSSLETYKQNYDVVLVDDQTMDFANALLSDISSHPKKKSMS